jgi:putative spermidine/putrescine transport system permease protein
MRRLAAGAGWAYLAAAYMFIIGPMLFIAAISFNAASSFPAPFQGLTVRWYSAILAHPQFISAAWTSALIAVVSAVVATAAAFLAAYAMCRHRRRESVLLGTLLASPILVPQIVISLAFLQFAGLFGLGTGLLSLISVHTVHSLPFALRLVLTGLARFDFSLEDASLSLGGGRLATWREITLPLLQPNLVAGFTFCFILSFVNLPISLFLTDAQTTTLPLVMFAYIEARIDPMLAAIATIIVAVACLATLILERFLNIRVVE